MKLLTVTELFFFLVIVQPANAGVIFEDELINSDKGNQEVTFSATQLASHTEVTINFDLFIQDSWDGGNTIWGGPDVFGFKVDGIEIFSASFNNFHPLGTLETNTVVATNTGEFNANNRWSLLDRYFDNYNDGFTVAHTGSTFDLTFFGTGLQRLSDESWRVTDIDVNTVPEPTVIGLMVAGLIGFGTSRRIARN